MLPYLNCRRNVLAATNAGQRDVAGNNKLQNAKDFMTNKNYPFYVLMDTDNKMVEDFKVSGIPTKFVIDKEGKIRFKAIGFNGNDDALVDELTTMIELAGK